MTVIVLDNVAPVVAPLVTSTAFETPLALSLAPQATDADADPLTFVCCEGVRGGTVAVVDSAKDVLNVEFTPDAGFAGVGGFSYVADDQNGHSVAGSVEITVEPPANTAPTAVDGTVEAEAGIDHADLPRPVRHRPRPRGRR